MNRDQKQEQLPRSFIKVKCPDPIARTYHASAFYKNYLITFGGYNGAYLNDIRALDIRNQTWADIELKGASPKARLFHTMCVRTQHHSIVVYGGQERQHVMNETLLMSFSLNEGKKLMIDVKVLDTKNSPHRAEHTAHIHQNHMYVFGGIDDCRQKSNKLLQLDLGSLVWTECETSGEIPEKRSAHSSVLSNDRLFVFSGYSKQPLDDLHVLYLQTMVWAKLNPRGLKPAPRKGCCMQEKNGTIYIFGGTKANAISTNDMFAYSIGANHWEEVKVNGETPCPREYHTSGFYHNHLIVWGGYECQKNRFLPDIYSVYLGEMTTHETKKISRMNDQHFVIKEFFLNKTFADVIFKVEDQEFPAHKIILATGCKFFKNMFTSPNLTCGMLESDSKTISISDMSARTFKDLLSYIYYEEIILDEELALELLFISDKYLLYELKLECEDFCAKILNIHNFVKIAKAAEAYEASNLKEAIYDFAAENATSLKERNDFNSLPRHILDDILESITEKKSTDEVLEPQEYL